MNPEGAERQPPRWTRFVPLLYLVFGLAWIFASDSVVGWLFRDSPHMLLAVGTAKGFAFVAFTTLVLTLWWRMERRRNAALVAMAEARAHRRVERQRDLYELLSHCNRVVSHVADAQSLYDAVVRLCVEHGRFQFAWIAELQPAGTVRCAANYGADGGYVARIAPLVNTDETAGTGLIALSLRDGVTVVSNDVLVDPVMRPRHALAREVGIRACAGIPFRRRGAIAGMLLVYSGEKHVFDPSIVATLEEIADEVGNGLETQQMRRDLEESRNLLVQTNSRLEETVALRTQELSDARDRAEQADRAKTAFLSTISHELRTPLNSIIGFTDILLLDLPGPLNEEQRKQLSIVHESSRVLLELINEMLDLSRIEAGRLQFNLEAFDLGELLRRRVEALRSQSDAKGLALECHIEPGQATITSDSRRVAQIVTNLLSNAIKFTAAGRVALRARSDGTCAVVEVSDTGPGIALEDMPHLFKPFMQGGEAQRSHREGTGLGLVISRHLARALGGDITVSSAPGQGATFVLTLPVAGPLQDEAHLATGLFRRFTPEAATT